MRRCGSATGNEVLVHRMAVVTGPMVTGPMVTGAMVIGAAVTGPMVIGAVVTGAPIKGEVMGTGDIVTGVPMVLVEEKFFVIRQKVSEVALGNVEVLESVGAHGVTGARPI